MKKRNNQAEPAIETLFKEGNSVLCLFFNTRDNRKKLYSVSTEVLYHKKTVIPLSKPE